MDGISHEAAAIAGRLCLEKLAVLLDASAGAGGGGGAPADDVAKRFAAYGWATKRVDRSDHGQIAAALSFAARARKPTLIVCSAVTETPLQWDEPPFVIPPDPRQRWLAAGTRGASSRRAWLKRLARHAQRGEFERLAAGRLPDNWHLAAADLRQGLATDRPKQGTLACSVHCLEGLIPAIPELTPGLPGPEAAMGLPAIEAGNYGGRILDFGAAAHGMAGVANGMALHGGMIPVIATEAGSADRLRPALRMAAVMRKRVIYLLTDGGAEHLASLRAIPNVCVFRPSGPAETAECWELALRRSDGPSVLVLSAQPVPEWRLSSAENRCAKGGYVLAEADGPRQATLVATGPEVAAAMEARDQLAEGGVGVAVVSLPCWALFAQQYPAYRDQVLGSAPRIGVEAGSSFGWDRWLGADGSFIGMQGFGLPPAYRGPDGPFAIAPAAAAAAVMRRLG
jgi:transketolase